jgi:hypothetical protein
MCLLDVLRVDFVSIRFKSEKWIGVDFVKRSEPLVPTHHYKEPERSSSQTAIWKLPATILFRIIVRGDSAPRILIFQHVKDIKVVLGLANLICTTRLLGWSTHNTICP